jgi:hypothetical protein
MTGTVCKCKVCCIVRPSGVGTESRPLPRILHGHILLVWGCRCVDYMQCQAHHDRGVTSNRGERKGWHSHSFRPSLDKWKETIRNLDIAHISLNVTCCARATTDIYIASSPPLGHHHSYIYLHKHTHIPLPQLVQAVTLK